MMDTKDKTDIVKGLRDIARAVEQDAPNAMELLGIAGREMLVQALKANADDIPSDEAETIARREISAISTSMAKFHQHQMTEVEILNERLLRQFDPAMAWNEAINRAIVAKRAAREEVIEFTPSQRMMFDKFQVPTTLRALRSA